MGKVSTRTEVDGKLLHDLYPFYGLFSFSWPVAVSLYFSVLDGRQNI